MPQFRNVPEETSRAQCPGPLAEHMGQLGDELERAGYAVSTAERILVLTRKLSRFALASGVADVRDIDERLIKAFLRQAEAQESSRDRKFATMLHLKRYLCRCGLLKKPEEPKEETAEGILLREYDLYLRDVRGLASITREIYVRKAKQFLAWGEGRSSRNFLHSLNGVDILDYITTHVNLHGRKWKQQLCSSTRVFLRYLFQKGITEKNLDRCVPSVQSWKLDSVPRHLAWADVEALLASVNTDSPQGKRDRAILLLIAKLGLRGHEVQQLEMHDILWRSGEIRIRCPKNRRERLLPLPEDVGQAIIEYLLQGRPAMDTKCVFLRTKAPLIALSPQGIGHVIRRHLMRVNLPAVRGRVHLLRHSLATRMVNCGVSVKEIADVLGHLSIDTTAIYLKVNLTDLSQVALPFPEGGDA